MPHIYSENISCISLLRDQVHNTHTQTVLNITFSVRWHEVLIKRGKGSLLPYLENTQKAGEVTFGY